MFFFRYISISSIVHQMTSPHGQPGDLPAAQRAAITKCEQVVDEYQRRQIGKAGAIRALTSSLSAEEAGLDNAAVDDSLDSYLRQLDDADRVRKEAGQELQQRFRNQSTSKQDGHREGGGENQAEQVHAVSQSTLRSHPPSVSPRSPSPLAGKERSCSASHEPSSDGHRDSRRRPNPAQFAWAEPNVPTDEFL